jgi:hypothetical protein
MLVEDRVDVGSEPRAVEDWSAREEGDGCVGADEPTPPKRRQLADRDAVAGDDERLAAVERAHDLPAFVPKLTLADLSRHIRSVARVLHDVQRACDKPRSVCATTRRTARRCSRSRWVTPRTGCVTVSERFEIFELEVRGANGAQTALELLPVPEQYRWSPPQALGPATNVAEAYARVARDYREGTQLCPTFDDAVTRHRMLAAIETAAATGERQTL